MNTGLTIVLPIVIGAAITWWWASRGGEPAAPHTSPLQSVGPDMPVLPELPGGFRSPSASAALPAVAPVASVASPAVKARRRGRDDSTYDTMLAFAQADPRAAATARDLIDKHERFLFTADDPDWGRLTERALMSFFQAKSAGGPQITAVSCRSAGCEVQALTQPFCGGQPCELQRQSDSSTLREASNNVDPVGELRADSPGDLPLRRQALIFQPIGERAGILVTYSREARKP